jgi:hypothetical protein
MNIGPRVHEHVLSPFKVFNNGQMCDVGCVLMQRGHIQPLVWLGYFIVNNIYFLFSRLLSKLLNN